MTQIDARLVDDIFSAALDLEVSARERYIDERCGGDETLRERVLSLVAAAEADEDALDNRFSGLRDRMFDKLLSQDDERNRDGEDLSGQRIGTWRLESRLARGGLATVYVAQRADGAYDQRAAFKVLRRGLDTDDLVARFRAERQILSALEYPGIAKILDGGALDDGRPYLVLEYVDGKSITDHCRESGATLEERVTLLRQVLQALHHAHRHLIVHRDIKPSNILVSSDGHVSLLDFGIAKLLDPKSLPGASTMTRTGISMLTPGYCSPEQFAGEAVTTASDIYQAGAVLYELLSGTRPGLVSDSELGATLPSPSQVIKGRPDYERVRGDLDAIVHKAMHTDPEQRYASAEEMDADLRRFLEGRPVLAQPDTLAYRISRLHKRKPWLIPATTSLVILLVGFIASLLMLNQQLRVEQQRAVESQNFLVDILSSADPFRPADADLGQHITVVEALDLGVARLDEDILSDPELKASVMSSIAAVYASLDQHKKAVRLQEDALEIQRSLFGDISEPVFDGLRLLATQYQKLGDYETAAATNAELVAAAEALYGTGNPAYGAAKQTAAQLASALGDTEEAIANLQEAVAVLDGSTDEFSEPLLSALLLLANLTRYDGDASLVHIDKAMTIAETHGEDSLPVALVLSQRATNYSAMRDYEDAEANFKMALAMYEARLGPEHGATLNTVNNLGILYNRMGRTEDAAEVYADALARYRAKFGESHRTVARGYQNLATALTRLGRYAESIPMHQRAFEIYRDVLPADQEIVAYPLFSKAFAEVNSGDFSSAESTARTSLDIVRRTAANRYVVGIAHCLVARALEGQGDARSAAEMAAAHEILTGSIVSDTYAAFCRLPQ